MKTFSLALVLSVLGSVTVLAQALRPKDKLEENVGRALNFLGHMQEKDGSWTYTGEKSHGITSLAVLAFLSAGHVPGEGPYAATLDKGIRWVLANQQPSGLFAANGSHEMYQHGISTLMLAQVVGMTDPGLAKELKPKLAKGVQVILRGQKTAATPHRGGWRYTVDAHDADMSVTGWQLLALRAAKNVGCDVPGERIDMAIEYVLRCRDSSNGGFCYTPFGGATAPCTGTGILALEICGKERHHTREALQAGSYLLKRPLAWNDTYFFYSVYYSSQAMFQLGNNYWNFYRPQLHKVLFDNQQSNGSWIGQSEGFCPSYSTAMAVLALTVEYRFLPIYQRHEEEKK
jgi:hypothetical protein